MAASEGILFATVIFCPNTFCYSDFLAEYFLLHLWLSKLVKQVNRDLDLSVVLFKVLLLLMVLKCKLQRAMKSPLTVTSFLRTSIVYSVNPAFRFAT